VSTCDRKKQSTTQGNLYLGNDDNIIIVTTKESGLEAIQQNIRIYKATILYTTSAEIIFVYFIRLFTERVAVALYISGFQSVGRDTLTRRIIM
jgi:hypothetical protein